jgi:hypothetical protein
MRSIQNGVLLFSRERGAMQERRRDRVHQCSVVKAIIGTNVAAGTRTW